jgi:hypothetical protein
MVAFFCSVWVLHFVVFFLGVEMGNFGTDADTVEEE